MSMMSLSRRKLMAVAAAGLLLAGTAACGSDDSGGDASVIDWWSIQPNDGDLGVIFDQFAQEFNEENPDGPQAEITVIQNDPFKTAIATAVQAGDPPDLFQSWGGGTLRQQVAAGQVRDLTDDLADVLETVSPGALAPYTVDGRVYGIPWTMGIVGFWYNTELFNEAGISEPPTTWNEFIDAVEALKDAGITPIALGNQNLWPGHFWWSYLAMRLAGLDGFVQAVENNSLDNPGFVRAGELLQELIDLEPFQEGFMAVDYEEGDGQAAIMGNGEAAMELMGQWAPGAQIDWAGLEDSERDALIDTRSFFPFPAVEGGNGAITELFGGGDGLAVGINAPDETLDLLRLIWDRDNYAQIAATPGNVPVLEDGAELLQNVELLPVLEALEVGTGFQLYLDQDWPEAVGAQVNESTGALFAGQMSPEEVVSTINEVWAREG